MVFIRVNVSALIVVAGFQVIIGGRFWVITEAGLVGLSMVVCFAGQAAIAATMVGTVGALVKKFVGRATGGA